jgi:hypothetical protein
MAQRQEPPAGLSQRAVDHERDGSHDFVEATHEMPLRTPAGDVCLLPAVAPPRRQPVQNLPERPLDLNHVRLQPSHVRLELGYDRPASATAVASSIAQ